MKFFVVDHQFRSLAKDLMPVFSSNDTTSGEPSCHQMESERRKDSRMTGRIEDLFIHILSKDGLNRSTGSRDMTL